VALRLQGAVQIAGSSIGRVVLPAGKQSVTVTCPTATAQSMILLTALTNPGGVLWVSARTQGSFTVSLSASQPQTTNTVVQFLVIN
jgi:hypothetical protein